MFSCIALVALLLLTVHNAVGQAVTESLPIGKVVEKVVVQAHPDQSYAVFLPTGYSPEKRWPTVFCLDPRARGKTAIERFVAGADELGYLVLCSNNSRNGLDWQTISNIFTNFWDDAHARFSIDEKRTYAAGFSGGSRLAATFASRCRGCLAGVIACGAGFPGDIQPDPKTTFAYFGLVGVDDFNYGEMWELEKKLSQLTTPYHFETFPGGHEWPPVDSIKRALVWLSLQSMKASPASTDDKFIDTQLIVRTQAAEEFFKAQRWSDSYKAYLSIDRDFRGLRDTRPATEKSDQLKKSADLKKEEKAEEEFYRRQLREAGEIRQAWLKSPEPDEASLRRHEPTIRLAEWRKKKEMANDSADRRLARRIISHLLIESSEAAQASLRSKDYNLALASFQLAHEADPKSPNIVFEIARVYALKRQKKFALQSLEEAVALGFKDVTRLKSDDAFASISDEPGYLKLLTVITGQ
jgi:dienelactone hydrolase